MNIVKEEHSSVLLKDIRNGDCFLFKGRVFMKIGANYTHFQYNAVNLKCGYLENFYENTLVKPIEVELHYTERYIKIYRSEL